VLFALAGILFRPHPAQQLPVAAVPEARATPVKVELSAPAPSHLESRVTFAQTMPRTHGAQIYNNLGKPNLSLVMVAIPAGPDRVRYVRGSTPEARRYLAAKETEQKRIVLDRGPREVDTSEIVDFGPLKGRGTRHARNLSADEPKGTPAP
jgi:hypothetical protein